MCIAGNDKQAHWQDFAEESLQDAASMFLCPNCEIHIKTKWLKQGHAE